MSRIGFDLGYPTVAAALVGGEPGAFGELSTFGLGLSPFAVSDVIDFATTGDVPWGGVWPALAGHVFVPEAARFFFTDLSGAHAAIPTASIGANATVNNMIALAGLQTVANLNLMIANGGGNGKNCQTLLSSANVFSPMLETTTPPTVRKTIACTVGTVCKGRFFWAGHLYPVAP